MDYDTLKKKILITNILDFLSSEVRKSALSEEKKESVEVAIQCLETAYEISNEDKTNYPKLDLLSLVPDKEDGEAQRQAENHKVLGNTAMKNGCYLLAVDHYTQAINCYPKNAIYYCNRAAAFSRIDREHEAIADCKEAIKLDPNYGKAYGRLGVAYSNLGMFAEAKHAYSTALQFDPNNQTYLMNMKIAEEKQADTLSSSSNNTNSTTRGPVDFTQFLNNDMFLSMAREVMSNPNFQDVMSGIINQNGGVGGNNIANMEAILQAGQALANNMQTRDPNFANNLRRQFDNVQRSQSSMDQPADSNNENGNLDKSTDN